MKPTWLQRNFDLVAVALIAVFGLAGATIQRSHPVPAVIMQSDPVIREVRPKLLEIREEYEKAVREMRTQIRTDLRESGRELHQDLHQSAEDVRRDTQSAAFQVRNDLREAFRSIRGEMHSLRAQLHCLKDSVRETVRGRTY
ncbi:MAG: hypothetical protein JNL98_17300 [Bryobacterales bacterium]|nr:hypothetical protein [Bryobacterales bacterium]